MKATPDNYFPDAPTQLDFDDFELLRIWINSQRKVQWMLPVEFDGSPQAKRWGLARGIVKVTRPALLECLKDMYLPLFAGNKSITYRVYIAPGWDRRFISIYGTLGEQS